MNAICTPPEAAITGLGIAGLTRDATPPSSTLAVQAVLAAIADAGLRHTDIDGLIVCRSGAASEADLGLELQKTAVLRDLRLLQVVHGEGTSVIQAIQTAAMSVGAGLAKHVVCVFADAPVKPGKPTHESFGRVKTNRGIGGLRYSAGLFGGGAVHALAAQRHMALYGTTHEHLGAVAVSARAWARMNPLAVLRKPLTMEDYLASRWIVEPFRLYDCAMPVNGGIAVIVSEASRAADLVQPPIYIRGFGQGHPGAPDQSGYEREVQSGARLAKETAFKMAGVSIQDIDICQIYDAFTYNTLLTLEEYGFCEKGEGGAFVASGAIAPGGSLPTNTGGGHLSGYYLQGMTPVSESVIQARGHAGERQCARHDVVLVTNEGGRLDYHACLILSPHRRID
jgi:acetyl-CoA acetyltransferase